VVREFVLQPRSELRILEKATVGGHISPKLQRNLTASIHKPREGEAEQADNRSVEAKEKDDGDAQDTKDAITARQIAFMEQLFSSI
jgi:hypothetical protein